MFQKFKSKFAALLIALTFAVLAPAAFASGGTTVDVSVADVSPTGVVFNNSAKDFTVTGSAAIDDNSTK